MKRKYYMRGMGIGVLVTAILCAVALPKKTEPMTDEEIIARAKELGYVEDKSGVTAEDIDKIKEKTTGTPGVSEVPDDTDDPDMTGEPEGTPGPTQSPVPTPDPPTPPDEPDVPDKPATPTSTATPKPTATSMPKPTATTAPTKAPTEALKATVTPVPTKEPGTTSYTITVERGATARLVAEQLEKAGAVDDAEAFVKYLRGRNLTDFINIGKFSIPEGASHAEITKILTDK